MNILAIDPGPERSALVTINRFGNILVAETIGNTRFSGLNDGRPIQGDFGTGPGGIPGSPGPFGGGQPRREGEEMAQCKSCGARIIWAKTLIGKSIPLDEKPSHDGNIALSGGVVQVVPVVHGMPDRFISHFSTCPNANAHRRLS